MGYLFRANPQEYYSTGAGSDFPPFGCLGRICNRCRVCPLVGKARCPALGAKQFLKSAGMEWDIRFLSGQVRTNQHPHSGLISQYHSAPISTRSGEETCLDLRQFHQAVGPTSNHPESILIDHHDFQLSRTVSMSVSQKSAPGISSVAADFEMICETLSEKELFSCLFRCQQRLVALNWLLGRCHDWDNPIQNRIPHPNNNLN
jgi:hypothetical protein